MIEPTSLPLRRARLAGVIASAGVLAITVVIVGATTPGYRPLTDAVSRLGSHDEPHALFVRLGFVLYGWLILAGARPLGEVLPGRERLYAFLVGGYGVAAIVAGVAPKDPPRAPHTLVSKMHVDATLVGGALLIAAMLLVALRAPHAMDRRIAASVVVPTLVGVIIFPFTWGSTGYGLIEILLLALASGWLATVAVRQLRTRGSTERPAVSA